MRRIIIYTVTVQYLRGHNILPGDTDQLRQHAERWYQHYRNAVVSVFINEVREQGPDVSIDYMTGDKVNEDDAAEAWDYAIANYEPDDRVIRITTDQIAAINRLKAELKAEGDQYPLTLEELRHLEEAAAVEPAQLRRLVAAWAQRHGAWLERHGLVLLAMPDNLD